MRTHYPPAIEMEPVHWQHQLLGALPVDVNARIFSNNNSVPGAPEADPVLLIPGYGESKWATLRALETFSILGQRAVAAIPDPNQAPATLRDVTAYATEFAPRVVSELQEREEAPDKVTSLAHSMGGGILGLALGEAPELFGSVAFLEAIGHDTAERVRQHPDFEDRKRAFKQEFLRVLVGPYPRATPVELARAFAEISSTLMSDLLPRAHRRFDNKIGLVVSEDAGPAVINHAKAGNTVAYIFGGRDPLVKQAAVHASLKAHSDADEIPKTITMTSTDHKHAHIGWRRYGREHLTLAIDMLRRHRATPSN